MSSLEDIFPEIEESGNNSILLCNLNPIKTACHLLMTLDLIAERYSMASLRTSSLNETIIKQARSVLDKLFIPQQLKFQIRQVDLMNKTSLYYLERLDAF